MHSGCQLFNYTITLATASNENTRILQPRICPAYGNVHDLLRGVCAFDGGFALRCDVRVAMVLLLNDRLMFIVFAIIVRIMVCCAFVLQCAV